MNKKELAIFLSKLNKIHLPDVDLEQYETDSEIAAEVLWFAYLNNDIKGKTIADLGCGNGTFGTGALKLGAKRVYFIDKDKKSLEITKKNSKKGVFLNIDVEDFNEKVDIVIENPPFGVQKVHADKVFLLKAMKIADKIYSFHKIESDKFINALCKDNNFKVEGVLRFDFVLKKTMKFHKSEKYKVKVGCWILKKL
jgi:putative methylase